MTVVPLLFRGQRVRVGLALKPDCPRRAGGDRTDQAGAGDEHANSDTDFAVVWPGIDGYENPFGIDFAAMRDRFVDGLAEAMDAVPGVRVAFEPKPYEPRGHIIFGTTPEGILLCHEVEARLQNPANRRMLADGPCACAA